MAWIYNDETKKYEDEHGNEQSEEALLLLLLLLLRSKRRRLKAIGQRYQRGELSLNAMFDEVRVLIRHSHLLAAGLARGGAASLTEQQITNTINAIKKQFEYLANVERLAKTQKLKDARLTGRLELYAAAVRSTYHTERIAEVGAVAKFARRHRNSSRSCSDCIAYEAQGWVLIEDLVPPATACKCGSNCRCSVEYANEKPT